jgi:hypothetical protein
MSASGWAAGAEQASGLDEMKGALRAAGWTMTPERSSTYAVGDIYSWERNTPVTFKADGWVWSVWSVWSVGRFGRIVGLVGLVGLSVCRIVGGASGAPQIGVADDGQALFTALRVGYRRGLKEVW